MNGDCNTTKEWMMAVGSELVRFGQLSVVGNVLAPFSTNKANSREAGMNIGQEFTSKKFGPCELFLHERDETCQGRCLW